MFGFDRKGTRSHITIGILGVTPGCGVTHLAIALGSYCSSKLKKNTAFLELHVRNEISGLLPAAGQTDRGEDPCQRPHFRLQGMDYYPLVKSSEIPALMNQKYDCLILDMGSRKEADLSEFLRCECKLILGSLAPWKIHAYQSFFTELNQTYHVRNGFYYLSQWGSEKNDRTFAKTHHISIKNVPFIQNPLHIEKQLFLFFEDLLTEH